MIANVMNAKHADVTGALKKAFVRKYSAHKAVAGWLTSFLTLCGIVVEMVRL
jgi:hypothetical protein